MDRIDWRVPRPGLISNPLHANRKRQGNQIKAAMINHCGAIVTFCLRLLKVTKMRKNQANKHKKGNSNPHYIWGHHAVISALKNKNRKIKKLYITEKNIPIIEKLDIKNEHPLAILTLSEIDKLFANNSTTHQGFVLETLKLKKKSIEDSYNSNLIIALDQVTDPQNIGAIMRSAKVFGAGNFNG